MEELDLLKKDWKKNDSSFNQLMEEDIYKMIHKRSSSIVKWILIISIIEVALWTFISLFFNMDEYLLKLNYPSIIDYITYINIFNYSVVGFFIFLFYKNYKNISTVTSTKQLMKDILKTRKVVKYYVWYNLGMMVILSIIGMLFAFYSNPEFDKLANNPKALVLTIVLTVLFISIFVGIFWLFYRLIYGTLLRKLFKNYNELKNVDL